MAVQAMHGDDAVCEVRVSLITANGKIAHWDSLELYSDRFVRFMQYLQPLRTGIPHLACKVGSTVGKRSCDFENANKKTDNLIPETKK